MRALLTRLELTEATRAEIRKAVADVRAKKQRELDAHGFTPVTLASMQAGLDRNMGQLEKSLTAYWAASRKAERMIAAARAGERGATIDKAKRAVEALERRVSRDGLADVVGVEAEVERLLSQLSTAGERRGSLDRERRQHELGRDTRPNREKTTAERQHDAELKLMRARR